MQSELSVITKTYDFSLWLLPHLVKFPREYRFTLADRMTTITLELLDLLVIAGYSREKADLLDRANVSLMRLRQLLRLSKDLKLMAVGQYHFAMKALFEIGNEVGGWSKSQSRGADYKTLQKSI